MGTWEIVWVGWLVLFLLYEGYAALAKPEDDTLSENVWGWFDTVADRIFLAVFMVVLTSHFVFGWPGGLAVLLSGLPVAFIIVTSLGFGRRKKE